MVNVKILLLNVPAVLIRQEKVLNVFVKIHIIMKELKFSVKPANTRVKIALIQVPVYLVQPQQTEKVLQIVPVKMDILKQAQNVKNVIIPVRIVLVHQTIVLNVSQI